MKKEKPDLLDNNDENLLTELEQFLLIILGKMKLQIENVGLTNVY